MHRSLQVTVHYMDTVIRTVAPGCMKLQTATRICYKKSDVLQLQRSLLLVFLGPVGV